jgi:twitching motility protein PilT
MSEPIPEPAYQPAAELTPESIVAPVAEPVTEPTGPPAAETMSEPRIAHQENDPAPVVESVEPEPRANEPGVLLPMFKSSRGGTAPRPAAAGATNIERLLRIGAARGAADLFLISDSVPWIRVEGDLSQLDGESALSRADVEGAILEIAPESGRESIGRGEPSEWVAEFTDIGRIRCTTVVDHRGPGVLVRMIATRAATAEQLGLTREVQAMATEPQGIVVVAAPRGGGKSTLISALVDVINRQRAEFVITLERQVRLIHDNKSALVSQREIGGSADDWVTAAKSALRENPDVLVVDDLVSPAMVPLLLSAAAQGLLVFVSVTAPSTTDAV